MPCGVPGSAVCTKCGPAYATQKTAKQARLALWLALSAVAVLVNAFFDPTIEGTPGRGLDLEPVRHRRLSRHVHSIGQDSTPIGIRGCSSVKKQETRRLIPAGLVDQGFASLATFVIGLYALGLTNEFVSAAGAFALFFGAFRIATVIPTWLMFVPAEVASLDHERRQRGGVLAQSLKLGLGPSLLAAPLVLLPILWISYFWTPEEQPDTILLVAYGLGGVIAAFLSPIQDHVRRVSAPVGCQLASSRDFRDPIDRDNCRGSDYPRYGHIRGVDSVWILGSGKRDISSIGSDHDQRTAPRTFRGTTRRSRTDGLGPPSPYT